MVEIILKGLADFIPIPAALWVFRVREMAVSSSGANSPNANQSYQAHASQPAVDTMPTLNGTNDHAQHSLKHDPGISVDWSSEEQSILDDALPKFAGESPINKYIKIAARLPEKTVRDVALRCRWMLKKDNEKRRKAEEQNPPKKSKDKKDKPSDYKPPNQVRSTPAYTAPILPMENDDGIPNGAIEGTAGQLLEQNSQLIAQIKANFAACKLQENTDLLVHFRDNIFAISNSIKEMPGIINQMPPLPVVLNTELIDALLPPKSSSQTSSMPT